jgi:hypothetical protein
MPEFVEALKTTLQAHLAKMNQAVALKEMKK